MAQNVTEDDIEDIPCSDANSPILTEYHITAPALHDGLMQGAVHHERRLLDFLKATPSVQWLKSINLCSPLGNFQLPSVGVHRYLHVHFIRRMNWSSAFTICKIFLKHPLNIALLIWLLCVAASGAMLMQLLLGMLNKAFPSKALRHHWIEIDNQILNALFTLMSIYQHPILFLHLVLLCRWRPEDVAELRKVYCKNGAHRPNERAHISFVVALLHITCISQYVVCSLYWGYPSRSRSEFAENFFFILGVVAPVIAGVHTVYSPLGRDDGAASYEETKQPYTAEVELPQKRTVVSNPVWAGGLLDCSEDPAACYFSFLCTFCVFGWNMERLQQHVRAHRHVPAVLRGAVVGVQHHGAQHPQLCPQRRCGRRWDCPVLLRAPVRGFLEDPDEEEAWAAQEQVVLWLGVADGLRAVAVLLALRACAGGAHGEPVRRGGWQLLWETNGR